MSSPGTLRRLSTELSVADLTSAESDMIPITREQIDACTRLHEKLQHWRIAEGALCALRDAMPGWSSEETLLKCTAINSLYSTQVYAIQRMAAHVEGVIFGNHDTLVDVIAEMPLARKKDGELEKAVRRTSFASKLCHFFVCEETFPVYDQAARDALKWHLNEGYKDDKSYAAFKGAVDRLRRESAVSASYRELDRYLWVFGLYLVHRKKPAKTGVLLRPAFEERWPELLQLLPSSLPVPDPGAPPTMLQIL